MAQSTALSSIGFRFLYPYAQEALEETLMNEYVDELVFKYEDEFAYDIANGIEPTFMTDGVIGGVPKLSWIITSNSLDFQHTRIGHIRFQTNYGNDYIDDFIFYLRLAEQLNVTKQEAYDMFLEHDMDEVHPYVEQYENSITDEFCYNYMPFQERRGDRVFANLEQDEMLYEQDMYDLFHAMPPICHWDDVEGTVADLFYRTEPILRHAPVASLW